MLVVHVLCVVMVVGEREGREPWSYEDFALWQRVNISKNYKENMKKTIMTTISKLKYSLEFFAHYVVTCNPSRMNPSYHQSHLVFYTHLSLPPQVQ